MLKGVDYLPLYGSDPSAVEQATLAFAAERHDVGQTGDRLVILAARRTER